MLKKAIHKVLRRRHFWRDASFDELSRVYIAMAFRGFALGMVGIFVPVYILKLGYGIDGLALFFAVYFFTRIFTDFGAAWVVARFGPKHTLLAAYTVQLLAAGSFSLLESTNFPLLVSACLWGAAASLTFIALHVDFSKIKHADHGGKELGYLNILERIGGLLGPLVGGLLATFVGPQALFAVAAVVLLTGLVPLFRTAETMQVHQKLEFSKLKVEKIKRDFMSRAFYSVENTLCVVLWPAFLTLFVFDKNVYGAIGSLASLGFFVSLAAAYATGKLVDKHRGELLLRFTSLANAGLYALRPFVQSVAGVIGVNILNDSLTVGYRIPYTKGFYDAADSHPGLRIVYITSMEVFGTLSKCTVWALIYVLSMALSDFQTITVGFFVASVASILINTHKFKALQVKK